MEPQVLMQELGKHENSHYYHVGDGFTYNLNSCINGTFYFRCSRLRGSGCRGTAILKQGSFYHNQPHNHEGDRIYPQYLSSRRNILNRVRSAVSIDFSDILIEENLRFQNNEVTDRLTFHRLQPSMYRAWRNAMPTPPVSIPDMIELLKDPNYTFLSENRLRSENILKLSGTANDGCHFLLFSSQKCINLIKMIPFIFGFSTSVLLKNAHEQFEVHTIGTVWCGEIIELAWCLLEKDSYEAYLEVLGTLRSYVKTWVFQNVMCSPGSTWSCAYERVFGVQLLRSIHDYMQVLADFISANLNIDFIKSHLPLLTGFLRMCFSFSILPSDMMEKGVGVLWKTLHDIDADVMTHMSPLVNFLQRQWVSDNHYSVSGNPDRTMKISCKDMQMQMFLKSQEKCAYSFIRLIMELEMQSGKRIDLASKGMTMNSPMEPFSSNAQIKVLTLDLLQPLGSLDNAIFNLLNIASDKLKHAINNILPVSIRSS